MIRFFIFTFLIFINATCFAQIADSTHQLQEVTIQTERFTKYLVGQDIDIIDTSKLQLFATKSMAQLLQSEANINIRMYSNSGLATLNVRGSSSSQFNIQWSGLNLQSSMNGIIDLNLYPTGLFSNIALAKGGTSSISGSGAIGSVLILDNQHILKSIGIDIGSFGLLNQNIQWGFVKNKWFHQSSLIHTSQKNDFSYNNFSRIGNPRDTNTNASSENLSYNQTTKYFIDNTKTIECNIWWMNAERRIPSTMTESKSDAVQNDNFTKFGLKYNQNISSNTLFTSKFGILDDYNVYQSSLISRSFNHTFDYIFENILEKNWEKNSGYFGINFTKNQAFSNNLTTSRSRTRIPIFGGFKNKNTYFNTSILMRLEWIDFADLPFTGHLGFEKNIKAHKFGVAFSRNFNLPTFNDLYWYIGGNRDLQAEKSNNINISYQYKKESNTLKINTYAMVIDNWIQWIPRGPIYSPINYKQVYSRGIEVDFEKKIQNWKYKIIYSFNNTTNTKIYNRDTAILDKQLIYSPNHLVNIAVDYHSKLLNFGFQSNFISNRFTSPSNEVENIMPSFGLLNFYAKKTFHLFDLQLEVNNLLNSQYQYLQFRQMPGINYKLSLKYKL
jgi:vitamin B12 transporter